MNKNKILQMFAVLAAILVIVGSLTKLTRSDSMSLSEYAALNSSARPPGSPKPGEDQLTASPAPEATSSPVPAPVSSLTGASLNGSSLLDARTTYTEGFYYEPISDNLRRYMTGVSYPAGDTDRPGTEEKDRQEGQTQQTENSSAAPADFEILRYVHIWHYDFSGTPKEGELICNEYIAQDLVEIFYELYRNEYQLEKVLLVDEYDGDTEAAREDNNSFCFYFTLSETDSAFLKHASGLALDINPRYNPRITYEDDGSQTVTPASAADYANRTGSFPYKIDENDLCYKLFVKHGFTWSGNRNSGKDYQHFQKSLP